MGVHTRGVDYALGRPHPKAIRAAGYTFVVRYVSTPGNRKNLDAAEVAALHAAGLDLVVVFERGEARALDGLGAGRLDGVSAKHQADALGAPARAAIYAAVDFDPTPDQLLAVRHYLDGFAQGCSPHPAGVYGGYATIDAALGQVPYVWQAGAWSHGREHPAADLRQHVGTVVVDGVDCDVDDALASDYGGWRPSPAAAPHQQPTTSPRRPPATTPGEHVTLIRLPDHDPVYITDGIRRRWVRTRAELAELHNLGLVSAAEVKTVSPATLHAITLVGPDAE